MMSSCRRRASAPPRAPECSDEARDGRARKSGRFSGQVLAQIKLLKRNSATLVVERRDLADDIARLSGDVCSSGKPGPNRVPAQSLWVLTLRRLVRHEQL